MTGVELIAKERQRQVEKEGWTDQHDDAHSEAELVAAARAYCWAAYCEVTFAANKDDLKLPPNDWPVEWSREYWKPSNHPIRNLIKAGALIAAEIDRLIRTGHQEEFEAR